jgi:hypothetical protein
MKSKRNVLAIILIPVMLIVSGCDFSKAGPEDESGTTENPVNPGGQTYAREFWGEWIRMDTGERWYITANSITVTNNLGNQTAFNRNITLTRSSAQVVTVREQGRADYFLFASRIANGSFNARMVMIDEASPNMSVMGRAAIPRGGVIIRPPNNPGLEQIVYPDEETGEIIVDGIIPGDPVEIIPVNLEWNDVNVGVTPWNGQDMGIIPLARGVNLKTTIRMANSGDNITMLYADGVAHNFIIEVENIGTTNTTGASYELIMYDSENDINFDRDFILHSGNVSGLLDTIRPGERRQIPLRLGSTLIDEDRRDKKIGIKITSWDTQILRTKVWEDIVSINYYKTRVPFRFRSERPVQGVIKSPDGNTFYFRTEGYPGNYTYSIDVPWSSEDYIIVFLGASADAGNETRYSLAINDIPPSNWGLLVGADLFLHEPENDNEATAPILNLESNRTFMGYLHDGDIDFYRIRLGTVPPDIKIVDIVDFEIDDEVAGNYLDGDVNPGDTINLDVLFRNYSMENRTLTMTGLIVNNAYAPYFELVRLPSLQLILPPNHYGSLTSNTTNMNANLVQLLNNSNIGRTFQFRMSPDSPPGTMSLTVTYQDNMGIGYIKTFALDIVTPSVHIVLDSVDTNVAAGETTVLNIAAKNIGSENTTEVTARLIRPNSPYSSHLTINTTGSVSLGTLAAGGSAVNTAFQVTVGSGCPAGVDIPLRVEFTNNHNNTWFADFSVTVLPPGPSNVRVEPNEVGVIISWDQVTGASSYNVYHSTTNPDRMLLIGSVNNPAVSFIHTDVVGGTTNYYKVSSVVQNGFEGGRSAVATYSPLGITGINIIEQSNHNNDGRINPGETAQLGITVRNPGTTAVSNLQASLGGFTTGLTVSNNNQNIGTLFGNSSITVNFTVNIEADFPTGPIESLILTLTENGGQNRTWLNTVPIFDITIHTPVNVRTSADAYGSITVSWDAVNGSNVTYRVYASDNADGIFALLNSVPISETTYTHSGLEEGRVWHYRVSAVDFGNREGLQSSVISSPFTWYTLPVYNDLHDGGGITNGVIHQYRFPVIDGTSYQITWTGPVRISAVRADGTGTAWFNNSTSSGQNGTADFTGFMVLRVEGTGSGDYSIQITSGTQAVSSFGFDFVSEGFVNGTINHASKTIDVLVPFLANVLSLTPIITGSTEGDVYYTGFNPIGVQNFMFPHKYVFEWSDGSRHTYTVTVTAKGQGGITIIPPGMIEDETVGGFAANITVSKTGTGHGTTHQLQVAEGYSSYEWYVNGVRRNADAGSGNRNFTIRAADYADGRHTLTIIVWKDGVPYSNEQSFTVIN